MNDIALRFTARTYDGNTHANLLSVFRDRGYAVLHDVFERDSVDAFRGQVESALTRLDNGQTVLPNDSPLSVWPTRAPRLRELLAEALWPARMSPRASMFENSWLISPPDAKAQKHSDGWHKDRAHETAGLGAAGYQYPKDVHVGMYFEDMTLEHGPTQIVPGSHRDANLSPHLGSPVESFLIRKQDAVLWDQRCWHRGVARTAPGPRVFALFGFYSVPAYANCGMWRMSPAQRVLWKEAETEEDRVLYGGPFERDSLLP